MGKMRGRWRWPSVWGSKLAEADRPAAEETEKRLMTPFPIPAEETEKRLMTCSVSTLLLSSLGGGRTS